MADYFVPISSPTPDILTSYLQAGGPPRSRFVVLASMLSPTTASYSGFELFENVPLREGSEGVTSTREVRATAADGEGKPNLPLHHPRKRRAQEHPALSELTNVHFHATDTDAIIAFSKTSAERRRSRGREPQPVALGRKRPWSSTSTCWARPIRALRGARSAHGTTFVWRGRGTTCSTPRRSRHISSA